jgi:hypothetical protein
MKNDNKLTFLNLFIDKGYKIEIPIIQRDYAQGRIVENQVRNNFLNSLYRCLKNDNPLDLDFIYGSISNKIFIPLDGQQRLTTLFLLHWYLAAKDNQLDRFQSIMFDREESKFTYETRITSREFCTALVANKIVISYENGKSLSELIRDSHWYFLSWDMDPTISSMLLMLDAIDEKFCNESNLYRKLVSNNSALITFQFIEIKNFGLSDSLYIKMNARGKELTSFENFKAKFEQLLEQFDSTNSSHLKKEFSLKIDNDWTNLFWNYRDSQTQLFDKKIMNIIRVITTNNYAIKQNTTPNYSNLRDLFSNKDLNFYHYFDIGCFDYDSTVTLMKTLDLLVNDSSDKIKIYLPNNHILDEYKLFRKALDNRITPVERIQLFALYSYLIKYGVNNNLVEWIRIIRNLTENTRIEEIPDYCASINSINEMLVFGNDIIRFIADDANNIIGFAGIQVKEERIKALLILKNEKWQEKIIQIENHQYFKGQIGFILCFSGISDYYKENRKLNWTTAEDEKFYIKFCNYCEKSQILFIDTGLCKFKDFLFERALLCKGNYLLKKRRNDSFLIDSDRDISWKRLLRDNNDKRIILMELFDCLDTTRTEKALQTIISESEILDWRRYFIKYPEILRACGSNKFIRWKEENDILLLSKTQTNGYHREYYTYSLALWLREIGNRVRYRGDYSVEYPKCISQINGEDINILYQQKINDPQYCYSIEYNGDNKYFSTQKEIINYLTENDILIN